MLFTGVYADKELTVQEIAKQASSVVLVNILNEKNEVIKLGSGFIVSTDGKIMTNYHVIDGAIKVEVVMSDKKKYPVLGMVNGSKDQDIAVLKIKAENLPTLHLGDSDKLAIGEDIVTIGSPLGLQNTVSTGIVSSIRNNLYRTGSGLKDIQISAPTSHGSSGGALFNMQGQVIGITYAGEIEGQNLNYAIPINEAKAFMYPRPFTVLSEVNKNKVDSVYLALSMQSLNRLKKLENLGNEIYNYSNTLFLAYNYLFNSRDTNYYYTSCFEYLNNKYEFLRIETEHTINVKNLISAIYGYEPTMFDEILNNYNDSLDNFSKAYEYLGKYYNTNNSAYFDYYMDYLKNANDLVQKGIKLSGEKFDKGYNETLNIIISIPAN